MTRDGWTIRRSRGAALAGLILAVACCAGSPTGVKPGTAAKPAPDADLALIPPDASWFLTVRVAVLARKFGGEHWPDETPRDMARTWKREYGVPLEQVERLTWMVPAGEEAGALPCLVVRTTRPYVRDDVLKARLHQAAPVTKDGRTWYVSRNRKERRAVYFVTDRVFLLARSEPSLRRCLQGRTGAVKDSDGLTAARKEAADHDLVGWGAGPVILPADDPTCPRPQVGVASAAATLDVGEQVTAEVRLNFGDKTDKRRARKALRGAAQLHRADLLRLLAIQDLAEVYPITFGLGPDRDLLWAWSPDLVRGVEQAIEHATVRSEEGGVRATLVVPMAVKQLRIAVANNWRSFEKECLDQYGGLGEPGLLLEDLLNLVTGPLTRENGVYGVSHHYFGEVSATSESTAGSGAEVAPLPPPVARQPDQADGGSTPAPEVVLHADLTAGTAKTPRPSIAPARPIKLTATNIRKETALLFTVGDKGKLTFVQKLPPGEAVDLKTSAGQQWVAVFTDKPAGETFTADKAGAVWLLR